MTEHYTNDGNMLLYTTIYNNSFESRVEELETCSVVKIPEHISHRLTDKVVAIAHSPTVAFYYPDQEGHMVSKTVHTQTQLITVDYLDENIEFMILYEISFLDNDSMGIRYIPLTNNEVHKLFPGCPYTIQNKRDIIIDETLGDNR